MTTETQQPDDVRTGVVALVGVAVIAATLILVGISWWAVESPLASRAAAAAPSMLEHGLYDQARGGADSRAAAARELERCEWVDRPGRVVRIPIERAIEAIGADPNLLGGHPAVASHQGTP